MNMHGYCCRIKLNQIHLSYSNLKNYASIQFNTFHFIMFTISYRQVVIY